MLLIYTHLQVIYIFFFKKIFFFKIFKKSQKLLFTNFINKPKTIFQKKPKNYIFFKNSLNKLVFLLKSIFNLGVNILVIDVNNNYNYLPITQKSIFNRSTINVFKAIKYFNIGIVLYFNLSKKKFILKKFLNLNLINIALSDKIPQKTFDFNINIGSNPVYVYIFYLTILGFYLKSFFKK